MEAIKTELGENWKVFLLSIPLDVITFLFLIVTSGSLVWRYLGEQWGKSQALILLISGILFAFYYIFLRRIFIEHTPAALIYLVSLSALLIFLPGMYVLTAPAVFIALCVGTYLLSDPDGDNGAMASAYDPSNAVVIPVAKIYSNINGVYVQQFLANTKSAFEAYRVLFHQGKVQGKPEMISAYPRRLLKKQLKVRDVAIAINKIIKETGLSAKKSGEEINRDLDEFLQTQRETTVYGYEKVNLREIADEIEQNHSEILYQYVPLHYDDLRKISEAEGLEVINLKGLEVLAGLITYTNTEGQQKYAILMRDDDSVPQALKEFAIAHELGHWFAHIKGKPTEEREGFEFYHNSLHDLGQFEDEANKLALIILFPTPYLAMCDVDKTLNVEQVFTEYIGSMRGTGKRYPDGLLKKNMTGFIKMRINSYHKHKYTWLMQTRLPDTPLPRQEVQFLARRIDKYYAWAELNDKYIVIDANKKFADLVGLSLEELLDMKMNVKLISEPKSRHITTKQLEEKRKDLVPKFYVTRYKNLRTGEVTPVTIYAFPITEDDDSDKYSGSFGIVTTIHKKPGEAD
jgi:PAS domain S-box-containing protein